MAISFDKYQKRQLISSYFSVVLSITLVLFLTGFLSLIVLNTKKIGDLTKEQIVLTVYLDDSAKQVEINQLNERFELTDHIKSSTYVSKEDAAEIMKSETGEDFLDFLGFNPLQNSIDINFKADFVTNENLNEFTSEISSKHFVRDVRYDEELISLLNKSITKVSYWILIFSLFFGFIAFLLINSSIRLAIYAKRYIIKTMQMVGATRGFIRKPFIIKNIQLGLLGALLANISLGSIVYYANQFLPELELLKNVITLVILGGSIVIVGITLSITSTFFATQKYLKLNSNRIHL